MKIDKRAIMKFPTARKWRQKHPDFNPIDSYPCLDRADQVILIRQREGRNRMNGHMYSKLKTGQTDSCPCDTASATSQHLLKDRPLRDTDRLVGLVPNREFESRLRSEDFFQSSHTSDLKIGTQVATLPGVWRCRVNAGTGWLRVSIL